MKPETRNSLPPLLARFQAWMESERLLRKVLPISGDTPIEILRLRRNFKFRKLAVRAGDVQYICYLHYWPRGLSNMAWFCEQAERAGVTVPQPLNYRLDWSALLSDGAFSLVLPYIEGIPLGTHTPPDTLNTLGQTLGRLHGITGRRRGPLMTNFPGRGGYWPALRTYWRTTARQLSKHADFADSAKIRDVLVWLTEQGQFLAGLDSFNLTHGDPSGGNFLLQPDGGLCLIDCDRIGFEPGPMELANALLQSYCAGDTGHRVRLVNSYLENCPHDVRELWQAHPRFFVAAALLWRTQRKLQWSVKRQDTGRSPGRAVLAWTQLDKVIRSRADNWQDAIALLQN